MSLAQVRRGEDMSRKDISPYSIQIISWTVSPAASRTPLSCLLDRHGAVALL